MTNTTTYRRGCAVPLEPSLGHSHLDTIGPTTGDGFEHEWPARLEQLAAHGPRPVRLPLDWARLQPRPGTFDGGWIEWYESVLRRAAALGLEPWATLHEDGLPRWFDDEGGFGGDSVRWWPRWAEGAADRFGDLVAGWIPFLDVGVDVAGVVWRDTWSALRGGAPVAKVHAMPESQRFVEADDRCDVLGVAFTGDDGLVRDDDTGREEQRLGQLIRNAAELGPDRPVIVADHRAATTDRDLHGSLVTALGRACDEARRDGVSLQLAFAGPASALVDDDGALTPAGGAWLEP